MAIIAVPDGEVIIDEYDEELAMQQLKQFAPAAYQYVIFRIADAAYELNRLHALEMAREVLARELHAL